MTASNQKLTLTISTDDINHFCRELTHSSANITRKHAALIALEGFITQHAGTDAHTPIFNKTMEIVRNFSEETRSKLLSEYAEALLPALREKSRREITRLYQSVSRNGFHHILRQIADNMTESELAQTIEWIAGWCQESEQRARESSGFPDALNFKAAGIVLAEYQAMNDIRKLLGK